MKQQQHIVHLLYRFAAGGLENVLVQLINGLPHERFRHTIVALTEADEVFARRIQRPDVDIISLHKPPGQPFRMYPTVYRLLRKLRPDVMHSCNLAALEFMPVALLAGVPLRIHAEHGWDVSDPDGSNTRYRFLRRLYARCVHRVVVVSAQIQDYWLTKVGLSPTRLQLIANGVDCERFRSRQVDDTAPVAWPFRRGEHYVIGTVGRLEPIKNQHLLVDSFIRLTQMSGNQHLRLAIIGDGPLRDEIAARIQAVGLDERLWLPGSRSDIPEILRSLDCFVLPSLAEGTSCTLQEAMATVLPIVATDVGGNARLLGGGEYGHLVPSDDYEAMPAAIIRVLQEPVAISTEMALRARGYVAGNYSLDGMLRAYFCLFESD